MGWVVRGKATENEPEGNLCPDYGNDNDKFTIQFWHSEKFMGFGLIVYCGPHMAVDYVDYVDIDQISIIELLEMVNEIGLQKVKSIHCSKGGPRDCHILHALETDKDAIEMVQYIDGDGMLSIYVEHEADIGENDAENAEVEHETATKNVDLEGEAAAENTWGENDGIRPVAATMDHEDEDAADIQFPEPLYSVVDADTSKDSDDAQSIGEDSDFGEEFEDSDTDQCEDEILFESNFNDDVEWVGMGQHKEAGKDCSKDQEGQRQDSELLDIY